MSPPDGKSFEVKSLMENGMKPLFNMGFGENFGKNLKFDYFFGKFRNKMSHNKQTLLGVDNLSQSHLNLQLYSRTLIVAQQRRR